VTYLRCKRCRQRFYVGDTRLGLAADCVLCGGSVLAIDAAAQPAVAAGGDQSPPLPLVLVPLASADPGSYPQGGDSFRSLDEFVRSEFVRIRSRERDFGLLWRDGSALYRAAWIEDTGELYIVQLGPPSAGGGHVELLAVADFQQLEQALAGWRDMIDQPNSLQWLRARVRRHLGDRLASRAI
jgi:hypothetical protein